MKEFEAMVVANWFFRMSHAFDWTLAPGPRTRFFSGHLTLLKGNSWR